MTRRSLSARHLATLTLALIALAGCATKDAPSAGDKVAASGGDVAAKPAAKPAASSGMAGGLTDSVSTQADRGRIRGAEDAPVWLVEISDFQCPFCKQWHDQAFAALDKEYVQTGKVRLAYMNFPIPSLHPNARAASEAAMCASVQGKFWELHESLFISQPHWAAMQNPMPAFDTLATTAGVDAAKWRSCMSAHAALALIDADHDRAKSSGVQSTPTFFVLRGSVLERKIEGAYPADSFRVAIDAALAKARGGR
ncbi:MAG: thioredoxin domain-containing protein [bacterium]